MCALASTFGISLCITRQAKPVGGRLMLEYQKSVAAHRIRLARRLKPSNTRCKIVRGMLDLQNPMRADNRHCAAGDWAFRRFLVPQYEAESPTARSATNTLALKSTP